MLLAGATNAAAQTRTSWFSGPVVASSGKENLPSSEGGTTVESLLLLSPFRPALSKTSPRSSLILNYQPEFEFLYRREQFTAWNHAANFGYTHLLGHRSRVDFGHSFVKNSDPTRIFTDNIFVIPRTSFRENATAFTLTEEVSRKTTLGVRFDNTITRINSPTPALGTYLDQYGLAGTASLSRYMTQRHRLTVSYSLLKISPYRLENNTDAVEFLWNVPTVRAGISRFAMRLAVAIAESSTAPNGMTDGVTPANATIVPAGAAGGRSGGIPAAGTNSGNFPQLDSGTFEGVPGEIHSGGVSSPAPTSPLLSIITPLPRLVASASTSACGGPSCSSSRSASAEAAGTFMNFQADRVAGTTTISAGGTPELLGHPFHIGSLTYTYTQGPKLLFEITGGTMYDGDNSYLAGVKIERRFGGVWFAADAQRFLSFYSSLPPQRGQPVIPGVQPVIGTTHGRSVFSAATARIGGSLSRRADIEFSTTFSRSTANFADHHVSSVIGRAYFNFWLTNRMGVFVSGDTLLEDRGQTAVSNFDRQQILGGLQFRLSPRGRTTAQ